MIIKPEDIEKKSFEIISGILEEKNIVLPQDERLITMRAIHTTADFEYERCGAEINRRLSGNIINQQFPCHYAQD